MPPLAAARPDAVVLHCLPAHRGEETTAEVPGGAASRGFEEARTGCTCRRRSSSW
ncbi:MAG TPA: hypothetical protein VFI53_22530 [Myxococcaceae bacterium]|nr:hypothetical protein [Myxococcaceae bacterium]